MGLYDGVSPKISEPRHLQPVVGTSTTSRIVKSVVLTAAASAIGYYAWKNYVLPSFGSAEAVGKYLWEGEEPERWYWAKLCADVELRVREINGRVEATGQTVKDTSASSTPIDSIDSYVSNQKIRKELSQLSYDCDKMGEDIDVVRGPKGSQIRERKKEASSKIEALGKVVDLYMKEVDSWKN